MENSRTIVFVLAAAALSITLAAQMQSGPSLLSDHRPAVSGLDAWTKALAQNGATLTNAR